LHALDFFPMLRVFKIDYVGGLLWLDGGGPWGGPGDSGIITTFTEFRTISYDLGTGDITQIDSNFSFSGAMDSSDDCVSVIANGAWLGDTDIAGKPAGYPDFLDQNCGDTPRYGHWGDVTGITLVISGCAVPTTEATWGSVKSIYAD